MSSFNKIYINYINRLQAFCSSVEANVEALRGEMHCYLNKLA
jgi:hypothetical protein